MAIRKVVIPVAGLGTRLYPTTKALPKEMLPLGKYPAIQHVVEEMAAVNLKKVLFITSRDKTIIENQFDDNVDVVAHLNQSGQLADMGHLEYDSRNIEFFYTRQQIPADSSKPQGTGAAIATAESFVDNEHFVVAYGDTLIDSHQSRPFVGRMIEAHIKHNATCTIGVRPVPPELISRYGIVEPTANEDLKAESFAIDDVVEKPNPQEAPSNMAISARYIFGPEIFDEIRKLQPSAHGELGITDAIRGLITSGHTVRCVPLGSDEVRYDIGNHESYYKAFIDYALKDPNCGEAIRAYLQTL
ncbi:MAG: UTP--glucose-1-phosphate uridylyltransferase [Candidatus Latescibacteria bacterium]|jgi:UTP--glucose-1-phosphate uridylyltransferase|nr:UTP--glucose-1-phosphate uridylyltransferase [Candidatus Latescibacterota bacterium]MBT4137230.1 UTP--glucose-1-phosphate uridylyltransferase [Candidatus Latescibacterota bacterium]MBT5829701.1 UTP--glucose-1-phosphate uridylyltransferase [Candidatus Latescibacterota bacterium]